MKERSRSVVHFICFTGSLLIGRLFRWERIGCFFRV